MDEPKRLIEIQMVAERFGENYCVRFKIAGRHCGTLLVGEAGWRALNKLLPGCRRCLWIDEPQDKG